MIQHLLIFLGIILFEAIAVILLWFIAEVSPLIYTTMVIMISIAAISWWRYVNWREKQKIYDRNTLWLRQKTTMIYFFKILTSIILLTYGIFLIKVAIS